MLLVIEDETEIRESILEVLALNGYSVITAENGKQGIEKALEYKPELIICDIMMPVMDGFTFLEKMRSFPEISGTPFLFLSSQSDRTFIRKGMNLTADDYLLKPFQEKELIDAIQTQLQKKEKVDQTIKEKISETARELSTVKAKETLISSILKLSPDLIFIHDFLLNRIVYSNNKTEEFFRYFSSNEIHKFALIESVIHPEDKNKYDTMIESLMREAELKTFSSELRMKVSQSEYRWFNLRCISFKNNGNKILQYMGILQDIDENKKNRELLNEFYERMSYEMERAGETQETLIPKNFPDIGGLKFHSFYKPMEKVGGDFISYRIHSPDKIDIIFGDVSGHGVSAAMVSAMAILTFKILDHSNLTPAKGLDQINAHMSDLVNNHFITCIYISLNPITGKAVYSNAGHPPPLLYKNGEVTQLHEKSRPPLLMFPSSESTDLQFELNKGDKLIIYSDGFYEIRNKVDQNFLGIEEFSEWVKESLPEKTIPEFIAAILNKNKEYSDNTLNDDMTMLCLEMT